MIIGSNNVFEVDCFTEALNIGKRSEESRLVLGREEGESDFERDFESSISQRDLSGGAKNWKNAKTIQKFAKSEPRDSYS